MARDFNGTSSDYLQTGRASTATDNMTFCCWVNPALTAEGTPMINGYDGGGGGDGYSINVEASGNVRVGISFIAWVNSNVTISSSTWAHVLGTRKSTTWKCYVDGDGSSSSTSTSAPSSPSDYYTVGMSPNSSGAASGRYFDGAVAEVAFWDRALDDDEIAGLGAGMSPLFYPHSLVRYSPVVGKFSPEIELVNGSGMTVTGTSAFAGHPPIIYPPNNTITQISASPSITVKDIIMGGIIPFAR